MIYRGYEITAFRQFRGVWIARYEALMCCPDEVRRAGIAGDIGGMTQRQAIAKCKAEVYHLYRSARITASSTVYYSRLCRRFRMRLDEQRRRNILLQRQAG